MAGSGKVLLLTATAEHDLGSDVEGLIRSLGARFEAEVAREEDLAADDLALSLIQGRSLVEVASRQPSLEAVLEGEGRLQVLELGLDHVVVGPPPGAIVPLDAVVLTAGGTASCEVTQRGLIERLRDHVRPAAEVEVGLGRASIRGTLKAVGPDHLRVESLGQTYLIPISRATRVRVVREQ